MASGFVKAELSTCRHGRLAPRLLVACATNRFFFGFWTHSLEMDESSGFLVQTRNVGLVTNIPTAEYLSAWQVLGNLDIAEILRDYVASNKNQK